jgi:hypothetical protein
MPCMMQGNEEVKEMDAEQFLTIFRPFPHKSSDCIGQKHLVVWSRCNVGKPDMLWF